MKRPTWPVGGAAAQQTERMRRSRHHAARIADGDLGQDDRPVWRGISAEARSTRLDRRPQHRASSIACRREQHDRCRPLCGRSCRLRTVTVIAQRSHAARYRPLKAATRQRSRSCLPTVADPVAQRTGCQALRNRAATSPALPPSNMQSSENGWNCSRSWLPNTARRCTDRQPGHPIFTRSFFRAARRRRAVFLGDAGRRRSPERRPRSSAPSKRWLTNANGGILAVPELIASTSSRVDLQAGDQQPLPDGLPVPRFQAIDGALAVLRPGSSRAIYRGAAALRGSNSPGRQSQPISRSGSNSSIS